MSGPKGIQYRVDPKVARRLAEEQRSRQLLARWRQIESAAIRLSARCHAHDLPILAVAIPTVAADDTAQMEALADQLEHEVNQSNRQLDAKVRENRSRRFDHDLEAVLTDLAAVEEAARVARPVDADKSVDTSRNASDCTAAERRKRLSDQVSRRLGRLVEPASEIEDFAVAVVTAPLDRAPMLLDELDAQISERNAITNRVGADNSRLDALRVKAAALQDAAAVGGLLAQAANEIECQRSAAAILDAVTNLVDAATARVTAEVERQYVLEAVRESLEELGYVTTEVDGGGPDSVVLSRAGSTTHGVRARVSEGEVDLHSIGFADRNDKAADTAADQALCGDLDPMLGALERRGVSPGRVRRIPAGVLPVSLVRVVEPHGEGIRTARRSTRAQVRETGL
ncbi:hypothetical protein C7T36_13870 [Rhodococcus sp. AD45-ID]|uniref:hypothetical protein n=1 Tax=Rhodococcus TaxID=1827 RepID=UPI0005D319AA|nr:MULTISPECIES: hypothetical protein [Rhodococcus]KJF24924.1 hypothetical protein SZ00_01850 [Rhodococcus sp. AD45]PSR43153.1 hypothetical protein C7T36_13870 [Rhodococcus sp. AD45-ID]QXW00616.1 hypothetical protein KYT97_19700 [Rhodococcus globerulus]